MIYIIILLMMLACSYAYDYRKHKTLSSFFYVLFFIALVVVAGLRFRLGTDSVMYEKYYADVPAFWELEKFKFDSIRFEPGFMIFASIPRSFSPDFMWLQFFESIVVNFAVFWFVLKNASNRFLALSLYFILLYFNLNMQVMREALAVSMFLFAWPFFRDGKWIQYYIFTCLATFFHVSAVFTLLVPLCCLPGIRQLFVVGKRTVVICAIIFIVGIFIQTRFSAVFQAMAFTERMVDRVNTYSDNEMSGMTLNIGGIIFMLLQYSFYPLVAVYFINNVFRKRLKVLKNKSRQNYQSEQNVVISNKNLVIFERNKNYLPDKRLYKKEQKADERWIIMTLLSVYVMIFAIPMFIFIRYFNYFGLFCIVTVASWALHPIVTFKGKSIYLNLGYWILILLPYFALSLNLFNAPANKSGTLKTYQIYYPYYTRLDPKMDSEREAIYKYFGAR